MLVSLNLKSHENKKLVNEEKMKMKKEMATIMMIMMTKQVHDRSWQSFVSLMAKKKWQLQVRSIGLSFYRQRHLN